MTDEIKSSWICSNGVEHNSGETCDTKECAKRKQRQIDAQFPPIKSAIIARYCVHGLPVCCEECWQQLAEARAPFQRLLLKWRQAAMEGDGPTDRFIGIELCADDLEEVLRSPVSLAGIEKGKGREI